MVTFSEAINSFWAKAFNFKGRSTRAEYWWAFLALFLVNLVMSFFDTLFVTPALGFGILSIPFSLVVLVPGMALSFRRLHDIGKSGSLYVWSLAVSYLGLFVSLISNYNIRTTEQAIAGMIVSFAWIIAILVMGIILIVFACKPSQAGTNQYGDNPLDNQVVYLKQRYTTQPYVGTPVYEPAPVQVKEQNINDKIDAIKELSNLYKDGIITEEEFNELKKRELGL